MDNEKIITVKNLDLYYGDHKALNGISMDIERNSITAFIGPSGCGKSTFLRTLNRMNDLIPNVKIDGEVIYDGKNIYDKNVDIYNLRKEVGMVFQKPNPFPMSIYDNVAYGPRTHGIHNKEKLDKIVEESLKNAAIYDEVKDNLKKSALSLSGGQQQRLCIARALAVKPKVLLMDEPTSALDPISTGKIEELALVLKKDYTIVIVTHNMQQALRISDKTAFFLLGDLIEYDDTQKIFSMPKNKKTEDYITEGLDDMREYFDNELKQLNYELIDMASIAESMIQKVNNNIGSYSQEELDDVKTYYQKIDRKQRFIESECMKLLLLQQPVASDLRQISSILKMINDLQRIGDQAENISEILAITNKTCVSKNDNVKEMANLCVKMLSDGVNSFVNKDLKLANSVIGMDDKVDNNFNIVKKQLIDIIHNDKNDGEYVIDILMCAKYFEKIGDHCVNIAKWTVFYLTGKHI